MSLKELVPAERLIVAADFTPDSNQGVAWVGNQVLSLARSLEGLGVYLKVNSALRACGLGLINEIHDTGLKVFVDLKLCDIPATLEADGWLLRWARPDIVTVMCAAGVASLEALKAALPKTEVLGVTVLTTLSSVDTCETYGLSIPVLVNRLADVARKAGLDGLVCSGKEARPLRARFNGALSLNVAGVRPARATVAHDDQNPERVVTPAEAITAGADRLVVGRPITQARDRREAVLKTLEEISSSKKS